MKKVAEFLIKKHISDVKKISENRWSAVFQNKKDLEERQNTMELYLEKYENIHAIPNPVLQRPLNHDGKFPMYVEFKLT